VREFGFILYNDLKSVLQYVIWFPDFEAPTFYKSHDMGQLIQLQYILRALRSETG
jgi:hypothetical protein